MILFVCSQGMIRSRTAEVLAIRAGLDARSCGTDFDAIVPVNDHLIRMADVVICMESVHAGIVCEFMHAEGKQILVLGIEDIYLPHEVKLIKVLMSKLHSLRPDLADTIEASLE